MEVVERATLLHQALVEAQEHFDLLVKELNPNYYLKRDLQALKTDLVPARLTAEQLIESLLDPKILELEPP